MTERVELDRLLEVAAGFGTVPMLLTVDDDGRPRAAAAGVRWEDAAVPERTALVSAGRKSLRNAAARPLAGLLWPAPPGGRFALLVDGEVTGTAPAPVERDGGTLTLRVTSAILHVVDRAAAPA